MHDAIEARVDDRDLADNAHGTTSPLFFVDPSSPLHHGLEIQLDSRREVFRLAGVERRDGVTVGVADPRAWRGAGRDDRVFVAGYEQPGTFRLPVPPASGPPFRMVERRTYPGLSPLTLVVYEASR